jgi:hypothetical protein
MLSLVAAVACLAMLGALGGGSDPIPQPEESGERLSWLEHRTLTQLGCGRCTLCGAVQVEPMEELEPERCNGCGRLSMWGMDAWEAAVDTSGSVVL